jgi:hypothetical protein
MKVTIVKLFEDGDYWFKVIADNGINKFFSFDPNKEETEYSSEKRAFERALEQAKKMEESMPPPLPQVVYETGKNIDPLAYFMAANMSEEEIQNTIGVDLSKIDEP